MFWGLVAIFADLPDFAALVFIQRGHGPVSDHPFHRPYFPTAGLALARADRRSHHRRWHPEPSGAQRPPHRNARRVHAQETQFATSRNAAVSRFREKFSLAASLKRYQLLSDLVSSPANGTHNGSTRRSRLGRCVSPEFSWLVHGDVVPHD
jgi:hypothetical protein